MKIRIGTRGSKLALWQAMEVKGLLQAGGIDAETVLYKTEGDRRQDVALNLIGGKGLFTKALDEALLEGKIDIAVHSAKDMPTEMPEGLRIAAFLKREDPRDILISIDPEVDLENLTKNFVVGTSALRRQAFIRHYAPQAEVQVIRGNVDTRIAKMKNGEVDALVLAYAGVKRLGIKSKVMQKLNVSTFTPAVGQGAIAIVSTADSEHLAQVRAVLNHPITEISLLCERAFLRKIEGGCHMPVFGLATTVGETISFSGGLAEVDGSKVWRAGADGNTADPEAIGKSVADEVLNLSN